MRSTPVTNVEVDWLTWLLGRSLLRWSLLRRSFLRRSPLGRSRGDRALGQVNADDLNFFDAGVRTGHRRPVIVKGLYKPSEVDPLLVP